MALLFMDSFDHYLDADLTQKWQARSVAGTSGTIAVTASIGRRGSQGWRWFTGIPSGLSAGWISRTLGAADSTVILGFAFMTSGFPGSAGMQIASVGDSGTTVLTLRLNADMTMTVLSGNPSGTEMGTSIAGAGLLPDAYNYIEWKTLISNTGNTVLRVNGVEVLATPTRDTQVLASPGWTSISLGQSSPASNSVGADRTVDYDDIYVCDGSGPSPWNNLLGDCRVDTRLPTGPGSTTEWSTSPGGGTNVQNIDDAAPNEETDYNVSTALFQIDTFAVADAIVGAPILAVQVNTNTKKVDAGTATIAPVIRHGGLDYVGANVNPGTTYGYVHQVFPTIPDPGLTAWSETTFNAAEFGYKKTG